MKKKRYCLGCGIELQDENILKIGFTTNLDNEYCMRCFKLMNYGEYESVSSNVIDFTKIIKDINRAKDLVLYVVDILNVPDNLMEVCNIIKNDMILVLNKRDLLPLSVKDEKLVAYFQQFAFLDVITVSSEKNSGMDELLRKIKKYQKSEKVYVVGYTNAGKSSLISKFIQDYGDGNTKLSTSPLPSTTLNKIIIPISNKLTLIDTPGLIDNNNIIHFVNQKMYKKLNSKREIRPKTYQISKNQCLVIKDLVRINYLEGDKNSITFYIPNEIKIERCRMASNKLNDLSHKYFDVLYGEDLVIHGLGFIKIVAKCKIEIIINKDVLVFTRKNMI